jgi:hypothetical protein
VRERPPGGDRPLSEASPGGAAATPSSPSRRAASGILFAAGAGIVAWLLVDRLLALVELAGVSGGVALIDRLNLTLFQVRSPETLLAALALATGVGLDGRHRARVWLIATATLGALAVASGAAIAYQAAGLHGLAQVAIREQTEGFARAALTARLAAANIGPGLIAAAICAWALRQGGSRR